MSNIEKPSWFDLDKYKEFSYTDLDHWKHNFAIRKLLLHVLENLDEGESLGSGFQKFAEACRSNGFIKINPTKNKSSNVNSLSDEDLTDPRVMMRFATININAPKKIIIADFEKWIDEQKKISNLETKIISKSKIDWWIKHKVVPYLDLLIWEKQEKIKIPQNVLGDWLFPDEVDLDVDIIERVRKSTINKALEIMDFKFIRYLSAQTGNIIEPK